MLKEILIKNFILIDEMKLAFEGGFSVFLGETGAGKSIIFKAIDIALGAKASKDLLKDDTKNALIELTFEVDNEETVISREISKTGTKPRLNGAMVTLDVINEFRQKLVDIHSQHQTYTYMQQKHHIGLLDSYIESEDNEFKRVLEDYKKDFEEYKNVTKKLENLEAKEQETRDRIEFLKFQTNEIERAELEEGEEDELKSELEVLSNLENLKELTYGAHYALNNDDMSILDALNKIKYDISRASECDKNLAEIEASFVDAVENLKDVSSSLRSYSESLEANPARLDEINERLETIQTLKRKYGDVFETFEKLKAELDALEGDYVSLDDLKLKQDKLLKTIENEADTLNEKRESFSEILSAKIEEGLKNLNMPHAKFKIEVRKEENFTPSGKDRVEFLISTNVSLGLTPLVKAASGGEISRVMLAIKTVFCLTDKISSIFFDEIDTGISGKTSVSVAEAILELSKSVQVFAITHQPIIASKAKNFYLVQKEQGLETEIIVTKLNENEKAGTLAQMALGDVNDNSLTFAKELLNF